MHLAPDDRTEHAMNTTRLGLSLAVAIGIIAATGAARADVLHGRSASFAAALDPAHRLSSTSPLRADLTPWPDVARESIDVGAARTGRVKSDRAAPFMDWAFTGVPFTPRAVPGTPGRY